MVVILVLVTVIVEEHGAPPIAKHAITILLVSAPSLLLSYRRRCQADGMLPPAALAALRARTAALASAEAPRVDDATLQVGAATTRTRHHPRRSSPSIIDDATLQVGEAARVAGVYPFFPAWGGRIVGRGGVC